MATKVNSALRGSPQEIVEFTGYLDLYSSALGSHPEERSERRICFYATGKRYRTFEKQILRLRLRMTFLTGL